MSSKLYLCIRCGIAVFKPDSACRSCCSSDPHLIRTWRRA